eukprot:jgi/Botrbrau1/1315/Bobra.0063s0031.1
MGVCCSGRVSSIGGARVLYQEGGSAPLMGRVLVWYSQESLAVGGIVCLGKDQVSTC